MELLKRVDEGMVQAAKNKDKATLSALRLIKAALHNKEIDLRRPLEEQEIMQTLSSMVKQRKDSIEQFSAGGRQDLVEKEEKELAVIEGFLPAQMSDDEIAAAIEAAISETGASGMRDMGAVMKALMPVVTGKADGKRVSEMVKARLSA